VPCLQLPMGNENFLGSKFGMRLERFLRVQPISEGTEMDVTLFENKPAARRGKMGNFCRKQLLD